MSGRAQGCNSGGPPGPFGHTKAVRDDSRERLGVDRKSIDHTVAINPDEVAQVDEFLAAGADHFILMLGSPFAFDALEELKAAVE